MFDLVGNPEDGFSCHKAHIHPVKGFLIFGCLIFKQDDFQERKPVMIHFCTIKMCSFDNHIAFKWDMNLSAPIVGLGYILNFLYPDQTTRSSLVLVRIYVVCHFVCSIDVKA